MKIEETDDGLVLLHEFGSIERALRLGVDRVLILDPTLEEFESYAPRTADRFSRHLFDKQPFRADRILGASRLRSQTVQRLQGFLQSSARPSDYGYRSEADLVDRIGNLTAAELKTLVARRYVATRKKPNGADAEIGEAMELLLRFPPSGPLVATIYYSLSHMDIIALWLWHRVPSSKLIVVGRNGMYWGPDDTPFDAVIDREYIPFIQLIETTAAHFGVSMESVSEEFSKFEELQRRRHSSYGDELDRDKLTLSDCNEFLDHAERTLSTARTGSTALIVPAQAAAPLRFDPNTLGKISLLNTHQHPKGSARIRGAARAALNAAGDMLGYPGFDNAISNYAGRLNRIAKILSVLAGDEEYDDSLVVELGIEVGSLDSRVSSANPFLGEFARAEAAAFFSVLYGFLAQFELWSEYKSNAVPPGTNEAQVYHLSRTLLALLSEDSVATDETRDRVSHYLSTLTGDEVSARNRGAAMSTENALASAAGKVVSSETGALAEEVKTKVRGKLSDGIAEFMVRNGEAIAKFAVARGLTWLVELLKQLGVTIV